MIDSMMPWFELRMAVCNAAPDLNPPPQYWLESECSATYCRKCAIVERGKEFELGPILRESDWFERDEWEDAFFEGIRGYDAGSAGDSDSTEQCSSCGVTLAYWLTDWGIKEEIDHWQGAEMSGDLSEIAYNLDRLFECAEEDRAEVRAIAQRFLAYVAERVAA